MARSDDDTWDVTEGVGATALGVAFSRSLEAKSECPLFTDPYAQRFLDAAVDRGWKLPQSQIVQRAASIANYAAARTKWFDEFFIAAGANGITQAVILAAGLDARAWRLPWVTDTVVYEIDQPRVLEFKAETLRDDPPAIQYVAVPVDLRHDWPEALREKGFDPAQPTAWSAEGLLPYLPSDGQDLLFERIVDLSAQGSRVAIEAFGAGFFNPEYLAERRARLEYARQQEGASEDEVVDVLDLWYIEDRADVAEWFGKRGWQVASEESGALMDRLRRPSPEDSSTPRTVFVEGRLS